VSSPVSDIIRYRLQRAREALDDAEFNLSHGRLNVAANRIYYAMFYGTVALLTTKDLGSSSHSGVIALFNDNFVKTGLFPRELSRYLGQAFDMRINTDYRVAVNVVSAELWQQL